MSVIARSICCSVLILVALACDVEIGQIIPGTSGDAAASDGDTADALRKEVQILEQRVNEIEQAFEEENRFALIPSMSSRCRHLQRTEADYKKIQSLLRRIDRVSGDYAHESIYIGSGNTWQEFTADRLESKINPYWADRCNR